VTSVVEVAPGRFREVQGRYFEDFEVGHVYEHRPGRTITDADNVWFTLLTMNTHPAHFDYEFSRRPSSASRWSSALSPSR
jgi:itaconyl-CoA hydratase